MRPYFAILAIILSSGIPRMNAQEPLKISGELRMRGEARNNADFNSERLDGTVQVFNRLRLGFLQNLDDGLLIFVQLQDSRIWGEEGSSLTPLNKIDLHQAYLQIDRPAELPFTILVGRQKLAFGSERLLGNFEWDNVSRSFDALKVRVGSEDQSLDFWLAQVRDHTAPTVARNQELGGVFFSSQRLLPTAVESYLLILYDARNFESVANPAPPGQQDEPSKTLALYTIGARCNGQIGQRWHYDLEGAYQTGSRGFRDISAYGLALYADYALAKPWSPAIHAGYILGSGDRNPRDGKSETFANLFPDAHRYLGAMDYASWSNISAGYLGFSISPREKFSLGADWHRLSLAKANDAWYRAGGFNIGTPPEFYRKAVPAAGRQLGHEIDLYLSYLYRQRVNLTAGLSNFFAGKFIKTTGGLRADDSIWAYLAVTAKF